MAETAVNVFAHQPAARLIAFPDMASGAGPHHPSPIASQAVMTQQILRLPI